MHRSALILTAGICLAVVVGCGPSIHYTPPAYDNQGGLTIRVQSIQYDDDQLQLRLYFENHTTHVMTVNRDALAIKLPDGSMRTREHDTWFGAALGEAIHTLPPNAGHEVFLNYPTKPVTGPIALQLAGILLDGQPAPFPDYVIVAAASK